MTNPFPLAVLVFLALLTFGTLPLVRKSFSRDPLLVRPASVSDYALEIDGTESSDDSRDYLAHFGGVPSPCFWRAQPSFYYRQQIPPLKRLRTGSLFQCGRPDSAPPLERNRILYEIAQIRKNRHRSAD